jgi:hypothetical protein
VEETRFPSRSLKSTSGIEHCCAGSHNAAAHAIKVNAIFFIACSINQCDELCGAITENIKGRTFNVLFIDLGSLKLQKNDLKVKRKMKIKHASQTRAKKLVGYRLEREPVSNIICQPQNWQQ